MDDILDREEPIKKTEFSDKAFKFFIFSISGFLVSGFIVNPLFSDKLSNAYVLINGALILTVLVTPFFGISASSKSIKQKESWTYKKYIGLIGNGLLVLAVLGMIASIMVDIFRNYN